MSQLARDHFLSHLPPHQLAIPDRGRRYDHHLIRQSPQRIWVLCRPDRPQRPALRDLQQSRSRSPPNGQDQHCPVFGQIRNANGAPSRCPTISSARNASTSAARMSSDPPRSSDCAAATGPPARMLAWPVSFDEWDRASSSRTVRLPRCLRRHPMRFLSGIDLSLSVIGPGVERDPKPATTRSELVQPLDHEREAHGSVDIPLRHMEAGPIGN